ncbi:hypothetical protein O3G_MSEX015518 [Manduca sexta]|uniref:Uncharacterized protein n=1 Tax=Manduca sexta TaxID=7130 RepID=A0A921ZZY7_MANSE|nr:hypothetical protein O3G_MSEX015518 [Manduca sexta]
MEVKLQWQTLVLLCIVVMSTADDYENKLTKLWSLSGASNSDGSAVVNVTRASIVIQPSSYNIEQDDRAPQARKYTFRPRAIPLVREQPQVERNVYSQDAAKQYKSDILFPGNYMPIAKEKSNKNLTKDTVLARGMHNGPRVTIPLIRNEEFESRALDDYEEPIIEKPEGFSEPTASRRSLTYFFGLDDDDDQEEEEEEGEYEVEETEGLTEKELKTKNKLKKKKLKPKKLKKYMLPLLLAYKMKYFALVPVMIGGLVLLIGATGLAGFFFALFAAVMGLQKGGY